MKTAKRLALACTVAAALACSIGVSAADAAFGFKELGFSVTDATGSPATQAGSHPFAMTTNLAFNTKSESGTEFPEGQLRNLRIELPKGMVGDPTAVPRCSSAQFLELPEREDNLLPACPNASAVGVAQTKVGFTGPFFLHAPIYNLVPLYGEVARLGFIAVSGLPVTIDLRVSPRAPHNVIATVSNTPQAAYVYGSEVTIWGNPADPAHDPYRGSCVNTRDETPNVVVSEGSCPVSIPELPFLTLPRSCREPLTEHFEAESWQGDRVSGEASVESEAERPHQLVVDGCGSLGFEPHISSRASSASTDSASGLDFNLDFEDEGLTSPTGVAEADISQASVSLPEGVTVNPSAADGLAACSPAAYEAESVGSEPGEGCPQASKIGSVEVETPLLEGSVLHGALYVATPDENPFDSLLAFYMVIKDPALGVLVKVPAEISPSASSGQLVTRIDEIPQLPFSHLRVRFREGQRAPLVTPPLCGSYTTSAHFGPSSEASGVTRSTTFELTSGARGGPCPPLQLPFRPEFTAGSINNVAGAFSPFYMRFARHDDEEEITHFSSMLPAGVTGKIAGVEECSDQAIAAARTTPGRRELASPSCPLGSQIGQVLAGAGVGATLTYVSGGLYLAGPFGGDPLSIVAIVPAVAGPFDLGTVVTRVALTLNPITAEVEVNEAASEPIPHILQGIPLKLREFRVYADRNGFILNPTSCAPLSARSTIFGSGLSPLGPPDDVPVELSSRYQAASCSSLRFDPSFTVSTQAKVSRHDGASLRVKIGQKAGEANLHKVDVQLPKLLPSRIATLKLACTEQRFNTDPAACPAESKVGTAVVHTPLLNGPLTGPAIVVSHGGAAFPDLDLVLQADERGGVITIIAEGHTLISKGITYSQFDTIPDEPISSMELSLPEGAYSLLGAPAAKGNLCGRNLVMPTTIEGQNGAQVERRVQIEPEGCSNTVSVRGHHIRKRTLILKIYVPGAGMLHLGGRGLDSKTRKLSRINIVTMKVHEERAGKLKTSVVVRFKAEAKGAKQEAKRLEVKFEAPKRSRKHDGKMG